MNIFFITVLVASQGSPVAGDTVVEFENPVTIAQCQSIIRRDLENSGKSVLKVVCQHAEETHLISADSDH